MIVVNDFYLNNFFVQITSTSDVLAAVSDIVCLKYVLSSDWDC